MMKHRLSGNGFQYPCKALIFQHGFFSFLEGLQSSKPTKEKWKTNQRKIRSVKVLWLTSNYGSGCQEASSEYKWTKQEQKSPQDPGESHISLQQSFRGVALAEVKISTEMCKLTSAQREILTGSGGCARLHFLVFWRFAAPACWQKDSWYENEHCSICYQHRKPWELLSLVRKRRNVSHPWSRLCNTFLNVFCRNAPIPHLGNVSC